MTPPPPASVSCPKCGALREQTALGWQCGVCLLEASLEGAFVEAPLGARRFGSYELLEEIGRGGMGVIYRAWEPGLDRVVALKMLLGGAFAGGEFARRFQQEARLAARLRHPGIVTVHEAGEVEGQAFYAMELIQGPSLAERLRGGALPPAEAAALVRSVASAVEFAHQHDVLHRDLKPSNILLEPDGTPKVADFGLARPWHENAELTLSAGTLGSPPYMAPEQAAGRRDEIDARTDVYGLGAVLYHLLTGRPPHQGITPEQTLVHVRDVEAVPPRLLNPSIPRDLETICLKALDKEPARRYATSADFSADLGRFLEGREVRARPIRWIGRTARWARRNKGLAASLGLLALALLGGAVTTLWQWHSAVRHAAAAEEERYVSDVMAAGLAYTSGDWPRARSILATWQAKPGQADHRGIEWRLLWHRLAGETGRIIDTRGITVTSLAVSSDEREVAIADQSGVISLWPVGGGEPRRAEILRGEQVVWLSGSPEPLLSCGPQAGVFRFLEVATLTERWSLPGQQIAVALEATRVAVGQGVRYPWTTQGGAVEVWDYATRERVRQVEGRWRGVTLSPDGQHLVLTGENGGLRWVDLATGAVDDWPTPEPVWSPVISSDGAWLAAASRTAALVWDVRSPRLPPRVLPHAGLVWETSFVPGAARLATACSDRCVRLWSAATGKLERLLPGHASEVWCVALAPQAKLLLSGGKDRTVRVWSLGEPATPLRFPYTQLKPPAFDRNGRIITYEPGRVRRFAPDGSPAIEEPQESRDSSAAGRVWLDEGRLSADLTPDGSIALLEVATGRVWAVHGPPIVKRYSLAADAARRRLAVCAEPERFVRLVDLGSGATTRLNGQPETIYYFTGVAFSPDGQTLAGADLAGPIHLWNAGDGTWLRSFPGHPQETSGVAFTPDGRTLVSVGYAQSIKFWHLRTGREMLSLDSPHVTAGLAISPDGSRLAVTVAQPGFAGTAGIEVIDAPFD